MINIIVPMAGAGQRFLDAGYTAHKPAILTTSFKAGKKVPMVVAATMDIPDISNLGVNLIYIIRDFHQENGVQQEIIKYFPHAKFITVDHLTEGQACTCLLAKQYIDNNDELFIAGCDNGMIYDLSRFHKEKETADSLVFTYRNHETVLDKPEAYGWVRVDANNYATSISVKKPISKNPIKDHAIVASFWFKRGSDFISSAEKMIKANDRINNEFYADQVMQYSIQSGLRVKVFEVDKYLGWGTPLDYENYENTIAYWKNFIKAEGGF